MVILAHHCFVLFHMFLVLSFVHFKGYLLNITPVTQNTSMDVAQRQ